jgi:hypothetical protein
MKKIKNLIAVTMLAVFLVAGISFALDGSTQTDTTQQSELMQWILNLPPQLKGMTLKTIANDLAEAGYISEALVCYKNGIMKRLVEIDKSMQGKTDWKNTPNSIQNRKDREYLSFLSSAVLRHAPQNIQKYICDFVIANVVAEDAKKEAKANAYAIMGPRYYNEYGK